MSKLKKSEKELSKPHKKTSDYTIEAAFKYANYRL